MNDRRITRSMLVGAALGVLAISLAMVAWVLLNDGKPGVGDTPDKVLLLVTGPGIEEPVAVHIVGVVDVSGETVRVSPVDPETSVAVPGTSYELLRDAYPFGGGGGVAEALARSRGGESLPHVEITSEGWLALLGPEGATLDIPSRLDVFTGRELLTFEPGRRTLAASETFALAWGAAFLEPKERVTLNVGLNRVAMGAFAEHAEDLPEMVARGQAKTDLSEDVLAAFADRLKSLPVSP